MTSTHLSIYDEQADCELHSPVLARLGRRFPGFSWKVGLAFVLGCIAGKAFGQGPRTAANAAMLANNEYAAVASAGLPTTFIRYLWSPDALKNDHVAAAVAINVAINQGSVEYRPPIVCGGALVQVDLQKLVDDEHELAWLVEKWAELSFDEPYFHLTFKEKKLIDCVPFKHTDGKTYKQKWVNQFSIPAAHLDGLIDGLGPVATSLEAAVGNPFPQFQSFAPVLRVDWFVSKVLGSINGGKYLEFRRLTPGKTTLEGYLASRGASLKTVQSIPADERALCKSEVTGKPRVINFFYSQGVRPSVGIPLVSITDDVFDENDGDPEIDPYLNLIENRPDGHEVIVPLATGWLEYTLFDGAGKLVAEAPQRLVSDRRVPEPFTTRLHGAISCIRCHGPNGGRQPFTNDVRDLIASRGRILSDTSKGFRFDKQLEQFRRAESLYQASNDDVAARFDDAKDSLDRRMFAVTRTGAKEASAATAGVVNGYEYVHLTPADICRDLGFTVPPDDKFGVETFRKVIPPLNPNGLQPDNGWIALLHSDRLDLKAKERKSLTLTRREYERLYPTLALRAMPSLVIAAEEDGRKLLKQGFSIPKEKVLP